MTIELCSSTMTTVLYTNNMVSYDHSRDVFYILDVNPNGKEQEDIFSDAASFAREPEVDKEHR